MQKNMNYRTTSVPWASGWGALETTDPREAARIIAGESQLPFIPQLINRGMGSSLSGVTLSLLPSSYVQGPRSWMMSGSTVASRRCRDAVHRDMDVYEESWQAGAALSGDCIKVQVMGPWSLAVMTELSDGHRIVSDPAATRGFHEEWIGGVADHLSEVCRRFSGRVLVQIDEPYVDTVLGGTVAGVTEWDIIPPIHREVVVARWGQCCDALRSEVGGIADSGVYDGALAGVVMSMTASVPVNGEVPRYAQPLIGLHDLEMALVDGSLGHRRLDGVAGLIDAGRRVVIGVSVEPRRSGVENSAHTAVTTRNTGITRYAVDDPARDCAVRISRVWRALGLDPVLMGERISIVEGHGGRGRERSDASSLRVADDVRDMLRRDSGDL